MNKLWKDYDMWWLLLKTDIDMGIWDSLILMAQKAQAFYDP